MSGDSGSGKAPSIDHADLVAAARRQVEHQDSSSGEGASLVGPTSQDSLPQFRDYEVIRELHRGGQGVVYLAWQRGTQRQVAIKMVRTGPFATDDEQRRFDREIKILGSLKHPNVVAIHESGVVSGNSFFVMDFVDGPTLDEYVRSTCAGEPASLNRAKRTEAIREIIELFRKISDAVQAAHLRGIIHRDLKPSNIRVDQNGEPHVLDFGLAKRITTADLSPAHSLVTTTGQFVGTLAYASPEQAEGTIDCIDIRTDVYSLGVLMYEMLTSQLPYSVMGSLPIAFEAIVNEPPRRPGLVLPDLDQDIETILLTCLAKIPDRRYQSAGELARDLNHFLVGDPIEARRDSSWYVLKKYVRRHKVVVGLSVALVLLLITATASMGILYEQQRRAHRRALTHYRQVQSLAQTFIFDLDDQVRPLAGSTTVRRFIVQTGHDYLDALMKEAGDDWDTLISIVPAYMKLGDVLGGLHGDNLGDTVAATESYAKALALAEQLYGIRPDDPRCRSNLTSVRLRTGDILQKSGQIEASQRAYQTALQMAETLPDNVTAYRRKLSQCVTRLGDLHVRDGKLEQAREAYQRAAGITDALLRDTPDDYAARNDLALHTHKLGLVKFRQGQIDKSLESFRKAVSMRRDLLAENPETGEDRFALASDLLDMSDALSAIGEPEEALSSYRESLTIVGELSAEDESNVRYQLELALIHERIGTCLTSLERHTESRSNFEESLIIRQQLVEDDPNNARARRNLAVAHEKIGNLLTEANQLTAGLEHYEESLAIREDLIARGSVTAEAQRDVAVSYFKIAGVHQTLARRNNLANELRLDHWHRALSRLTRSLELVRELEAAGTLAAPDAAVAQLLTEHIEECRQGIGDLTDTGDGSPGGND